MLRLNATTSVLKYTVSYAIVNRACPRPDIDLEEVAFPEDNNIDSPDARWWKIPRESTEPSNRRGISSLKNSQKTIAESDADIEVESLKMIEGMKERSKVQTDPSGTLDAQPGDVENKGVELLCIGVHRGCIEGLC